ncbi:hypothetical protein F442_05058 [Phytophthora nicotianae P10297]|uniref:Uncharacterized protein n=1 Tax=Phytophthora nicotianae P10297 TaxID=1317064 RepID=W2ZQW4_PHYNI|nr:hypothetical protein F442_05058 [Phytophthora nicotianae P10297]
MSQVAWIPEVEEKTQQNGVRAVPIASFHGALLPGCLSPPKNRRYFVLTVNWWPGTVRTDITGARQKQTVFSVG